MTEPMGRPVWDHRLRRDSGVERLVAAGSAAPVHRDVE